LYPPPQIHLASFRSLSLDRISKIAHLPDPIHSFSCHPFIRQIGWARPFAWSPFKQGQTSLARIPCLAAPRSQLCQQLLIAVPFQPRASWSIQAVDHPIARSQAVPSQLWTVIQKDDQPGSLCTPSCYPLCHLYMRSGLIVKQLYNHRKTILRSSISPSLLLPMPSLLVDVPVGLWWACHQELLALPQLLWWSKSLRCPRYAHSTLLLLLRYTAKVHPSPQTN